MARFKEREELDLISQWEEGKRILFNFGSYLIFYKAPNH